MIKQVLDPALEVHNLTVSYHHHPALWEVDFSVPEGKLIGIIGPNGAGKSTLLKTMIGLHRPNSGACFFWGKPMEEVRRRISYVPQQGSLDLDFPISVHDVVMMGRYPNMGLFKRPRKEDFEVVNEALCRVGLSALAYRPIGTLSGGERQRAILARSLAQKADLYLLDEPLAAIDAASGQSILVLLREIVQEGKTIVVVHHDLVSAQAYFDWIVFLNIRVVASGPTAEMFKHSFVKETYGTQLTLLDRVRQLMKEAEAPVREEV